MTWAEFHFMIWLLLAVTVIVAAMTSARGQSGWVDQLQNQNHNVCCFDNDGRRLDDPEWRTAGDAYEVLFTEGWIRVPTDAVVTMANKDGIARVWSLPVQGGRMVRCFLPGSMG